MALLFTGLDTDQVGLASPTILDDQNPATFLAWVKPSTITPGTTNYLYHKGSTTTTHRHFLGYLGTGNLSVQRGRVTTTLAATASQANMPTWGAGKWCFICGQTSTGGVATDQKLFHGDLATLAAEPAAYANQSVGSGTVTSNAADNGAIGNTDGQATSFFGDIAIFATWSSILTLAQIRSWQMNPRAWIDGVQAAGMWALGLDPTGTGTQPDLSGRGNTGTVTGATVSIHVPLWEFLQSRRRRERRIRRIATQIMRRVA